MASTTINVVVGEGEFILYYLYIFFWRSRILLRLASIRRILSSGMGAFFSYISFLPPQLYPELAVALSIMISTTIMRATAKTLPETVVKKFLFKKSIDPGIS